MVKISVGAGKRDFGPDWKHYDGDDSFPHIYGRNISLSNEPVNSADIIYSSHLIAYFDREEVVDLLKGWYRVLKPGGILRLATPDVEAMANLFVKKDIVLDAFLGPLYGKMKMGEQTIYHKTTWDFYSLYSVLTKKIGFESIKRYNWKTTSPHDIIDDHSQAYIPKMDKENGVLISLNIEATK